MEDCTQYLNTMSAALSSNEKDTVFCDSNDLLERVKRFSKIWGLKEAYLKSKSCGISGELYDIDVNLRSMTVTSDPRSVLRIIEFELDSELYIVALAQTVPAGYEIEINHRIEMKEICLDDLCLFFIEKLGLA